MKASYSKAAKPVFLLRGSTIEAAKTVNVGNAAAVKLLDTNADRLGAIITNNGTNKMWVGRNSSVVAGGAADDNGGFMIPPTESLHLTQEDGYTGALWAICSAGETTVAGIFAWSND